MTALSDFYAALRLLLGDNDPYGVYLHQDAALDSALRSVFAFGLGPDGYALNGDRASATEITPDIPSGDPFALIAYEAGMLLVGGESGSEHYRTRALSRTTSSDRKRDLLVELRLRIHDIRGGREQFSTVDSFFIWLNSVGSVLDAGLNEAAAPQVGSISAPTINLIGNV